MPSRVVTAISVASLGAGLSGVVMSSTACLGLEVPVFFIEHSRSRERPS
jgi:hypothetical protein